MRTRVDSPFGPRQQGHTVHRPNITRRVLIAALGVFLLALTNSGCVSIRWDPWVTYGPHIEAGAGRANLNIYRVPRKALYDVMVNSSTRVMQDVLHANGRPPTWRLCAGGACVNATASYVTWYIYADAADIKGALFDAQRNYDCLAATMISYGAPTRNWTHKAGGCRLGSLPRSGETKDGTDTTLVGPAADDPPLLPDGTTEPPDPDEYVPEGSIQ